MDLLRGKLLAAVQQSLWDLYSEYRVFLPPPTSDDDSSLMKPETSSEPTTPVKCELSSA
jgi:hypothetical protein